MEITKPNYENSNIGITSSLLKYYNLDYKYPSIKLIDEELNKKPKNILYIILDGMGISIMEKHLSKNGFLFKNKILDATTVYPSTTVSATTALHSGLSPIESSWLGWHMKFKKYEESVELFSECFYFNHEKADIHDDINYESIYEKIINSNKSVLYQEIFPKKARGNYETFDEMIYEVKKICSNGKKNLISFYYNEPDSLLHKNGTKSLLVKEKLLEMEKQLEELSKEIKDTLIIITADHGHIDTNIINLYEYKEITKCLKFFPCGEFRCTQFYVLDDKKEEFKNLFEKEFSKDFLLFDKETFIKSGLIGSGNVHKNVDEFIGDYVSVAINNKSLLFITEKMESRKILSDHAGLTKDEMMVPIIMVNCNKKG